MTKKPKSNTDPNSILVCRNKKARFEYELVEKFEAGLVLQGTEVKSMRDRKATLEGAFARLRDGELFLVGMEIAPYTHGNRMNHEPKRIRKLLLHKRELSKIASLSSERGLTIVPTKVYFRDGWAKVQIAVAKGKKLHDKRQSMMKKDAQRDIERAMKQRNR